MTGCGFLFGVLAMIPEAPLGSFFPREMIIYFILSSFLKVLRS
jgi:hypothetical protein